MDTNELYEKLDKIGLGDDEIIIRIQKEEGEYIAQTNIDAIRAMYGNIYEYLKQYGAGTYQIRATYRAGVILERNIFLP